MRDVLRDVNVDGYRLTTWDSGKADRRGCTTIGYRFHGLDGKVIFEGEDFNASPMHADDSDEALRALLGFLTLRPGDTDREYFDKYTPEQMAFAESEAEALSIWGMEESYFDDSENDAPEFVDWTDPK